MPLSAKDPIAKWIYDFKKSDAPQFKGKSGEDRKAMAIAAYMDAKKGAKQEKGWDSEVRQVESTDAYAKSQAAIRDRKKRAGMTSSDQKKMGAVADMMRREREKRAQQRNEENADVGEATVHINLDDTPSARQDKVTKILKRHETKGNIKHAGSTDKGELFDVKKPAMLAGINRELKAVGGGYQLGEETVQEISSKLKDRYRTKARADVDKQYKKGDMAAMNRDSKGVKQADRRVMTRRTGVQRSLPKDGPAKKGQMVPTRNEGLKQARDNVGADKCWDGYKAKGTKMKGGKEVPNCVPESLKKVECPKCEGDGCSHCDEKGYHMAEKTNNLVAKHARKFNKAHVMADRKRKQKKGYVKHKGNKYEQIEMESGSEEIVEFLVVKRNPSYSGSSSSSSSSSSRSSGRKGAPSSTSGQSVTTTSGNGYKIKRNIKTGQTSKSRYNVGGSAAQKESIDEATSQKLLNKMKELAPKGQLPRNSAELRKLKARAQEELRGAAKAKKSEPKKQSTTKTSTGKKHMGSMEAGDRNIVMQLRKAQDLKGNHDIIVSPKGRTTRLPKAMIDKLLKRFDSLQKPQDKRRFQIMVTKELRKRAK